MARGIARTTGTDHWPALKRTLHPSTQQATRPWVADRRPAPFEMAMSHQLHRCNLAIIAQVDHGKTGRLRAGRIEDCFASH